ncbi:MAG: hypothetical protein ABWY81_06480 [Jiangellaceae bacterium]
MPASARPIAATAAFVALFVTGCGAPTNGLEEKSGAEVLDAATAAFDGASGVHVTGTGISGGRPVAVDLTIQDGSSSGTVTIDGTPLEITTVGADAYVKGDQQALEGLGIPPAAAQLGADPARLQPVHALVEKACGEYDEGAQCFAMAAGIGIPFAGTAAEREQTQAIECGFAASEGLISLGDALNQGAEITMATS